MKEGKVRIFGAQQRRVEALAEDSNYEISAGGRSCGAKTNCAWHVMNGAAYQQRREKKATGHRDLYRRVWWWIDAIFLTRRDAVPKRGVAGCTQWILEPNGDNKEENRTWYCIN